MRLLLLILFVVPLLGCGDFTYEAGPNTDSSPKTVLAPTSNDEASTSVSPSPLPGPTPIPTPTPTGLKSHCDRLEDMVEELYEAGAMPGSLAQLQRIKSENLCAIAVLQLEPQLTVLEPSETATSVEVTPPPISPTPTPPPLSPTPAPTPTPMPTPVPAPVTGVVAPAPAPTPTPVTGVLVVPTPRIGPTVTPTPPEFAIIAAYTGLYLETSGDMTVRRTNRRNSIELKFNVALDPASVHANDFSVRFNDQTMMPVSASVGGSGFSDRVFLTLFSDLPTNATPQITVVDSVSSIGAGQINSGALLAKDALSPITTVALSGGASTSGTMIATNDAITISITTDENLSAPPTVEIYDEDAPGIVELTTEAASDGGNNWVTTIEGDALNGATADGKIKSIRVVTNDASTVSGIGSLLDGDTAVPPSVVIGQSVVGSDDSTVSELLYVLDKTAPILSLSPSGQITDPSPLVEWDFGEAVSITSLSFGLSGSPGDFTSLVASFDDRIYFFPMAGLEPGSYVSMVSVVDLAGNESIGLVGTFEVN